MPPAGEAGAGAACGDISGAAQQRLRGAQVKFDCGEANIPSCLVSEGQPRDAVTW